MVDYQRWICALTVLGTCLAMVSASAHVEVVKTEDGYTFVKGGVPFVVKGAGASGIDLSTVVKRGGNSIRTWGIEEAQSTLDEAQKYGLTVLMGLPVAPPRFGFDYDNPEEVEVQRQAIREAVTKYKAHPALLGWILGNELDMQAPDHKAYDEVNELAKIVNEIDPNHPTTTTIATFEKDIILDIRKRTPDLDFISLQAYGALALMPKAISYLKDAPFMITEWGPLGHWEVGKTRWGAPIEQTSTEKGRHYVASYRNWIQPFLGPALGSYAFLWGQKQERTSTWFSLFTKDGEATAAVDALEFVWTNRIPANQAPLIESIVLARRTADKSIRLASGNKYTAKVNAMDPDGDELMYQWQIKPESTETVIGGDYEEDISNLDGLFIGDATSESVSFNAPGTPGNYRIFVMIYDGNNSVAHANIPFLVFGKKR